MLKTLIITILLLTSYTTTVQAQNSTNNKETTMEPFNIQLFNKNKDGIKEWRFTLDGTRIRRWQASSKNYVEERKPTDSPYTYYRIYNEQGILTQKSIMFYDMDIGLEKYYDRNGKLIKEENYDEPYLFSIEDLKKKLQNEYTVDIMDTNQIDYIARYIEDDKEMPVYDMGYHHKETPRSIYCLIIDGKTGKTLFKTTRFTGRRSKLTPYDEYLESLQETKPAESDIEQE